MGNKVKIPRSFSDDIGVADTLASIRRHYLPIPLHYPANNTTTGYMWGAESNTTGIPFLQRNITFEKLYVTGFMGTTVVNETTVLTVQVFKNGVSTVFSLNIINSTTQGLRWQADSTTAAIANGISTDRLSVRIPLRNEMTRLSAVIVFRERVDS